MIEIEFLGLEPPEGCVRLIGATPSAMSAVAFAGWTGLIQAIVQLVAPDDSVPPSSRLGG
ncbi:MAG TPA: hypothetical protein VNC78_01885 [Actinomycetota bacterium]|nr:hypothetical protein [Actinomycetota bacterium]